VADEEACLHQSGTDGSWLSEPFGDLFGGMDGVWRRDDTYVFWHNDDPEYNMTLRVPASEWDTFLGEVESGTPGIFMLLLD
jgi:hypothetical protein